MGKLDLTKLYSTYYKAQSRPEQVDIAPAQFLSLTGKGDPSGKGFKDNIQALYATAYTVKFMCKSLGKDFVVPKLEALWDFDAKKYGSVSMTEAPGTVPRSAWEYRLLLRMPDFVTPETVGSAIEKVLAKKQLALAREITLYPMAEGCVVQMLHIGPFNKEPETLQQMLEFIVAAKLEKNGLHHEIYLSDFNKTAPEKLKTILREPVRHKA